MLDHNPGTDFTNISYLDGPDIDLDIKSHAEPQATSGAGHSQLASVMPTLFISHGAPTLAIEPGDTGPAWEHIGWQIQQQFGKPKAIVIMSPHWTTQPLSVTAAASASILYDFKGFPEALYQLTYPCPGLPALAWHIQSLFISKGMACTLEPGRGLDHGAWVPLRYLFAQADIPVVQLSLPYPNPPEYYLQIGELLHTFTQQGVLLIGSGSLTHNLGDVYGQPADAPSYDYVEAFSGWIQHQLDTQNVRALLNYRIQAPFASRAHPQDDHLMPLFFAMGAADSLQTNLVHSGVTYGVLSMDCFAFGSHSAKLLAADNITKRIDP